jgi:hypothetical protein
LSKNPKDDLEFVQFNFEWTKKMRREAEEAMRAEGERVLANFVRKAVGERIKQIRDSKNGPEGQ